MSDTTPPQHPHFRPVGYIPPDRLRQPLYIVTTLFNPYRWKSRYKHYERAVDHWIDAGATVITVHIAYGDREHGMDYAGHHGEPTWNVLHETKHHHNILLRTNQLLWMKEAGINVGVSHIAHIDPGWGKVAWIDADMGFTRKNFVGETIHALERYDILQMFDEGHDVDPQSRIMPLKHLGFMSNYVRSGGKSVSTSPFDQKQGDYYYAGKWGWPGGAWACRREAWNWMGGMMSWAITGQADLLQAFALVGQVDKVILPGVSPGFKAMAHAWQRRIRLARPRLGFITGTLLHYWHGKKSERGYGYRNESLISTQFDPLVDLSYDWQGLPQLVHSHDHRFEHNRDFIANWQGKRNEDSIDMD